MLTGDEVTLTVGSTGNDCGVEINRKRLLVKEALLNMKGGEITRLTLTFSPPFEPEVLIGYWVSEADMDSFKNWLREKRLEAQR